MKKDLHPEYFSDASVSCVCGAKYTIGATQKEIRVEVCSKCHPFYTGEQRIVDTEGRVERLRRRYGQK
jgi:large subunit ribosomal protein L31